MVLLSYEYSERQLMQTYGRSVFHNYMVTYIRGHIFQTVSSDVTVEHF